MSYELVYTSARRGLRVGASGFCTVAATQGMPRTLQDKLESLSGYRHEESFAGREPPINFAHTTLRIQRTIYHVFSRVGTAAKDHTRRSNKIAHHLAVTSQELSDFDQPVAVFADTDFWIDEWTEEPTWLDADRLPSAAGPAADGFATWERVFGDAGWAGLLGQAVSDGFRSVNIIVPQNSDALLLLEEAMQLVKPEDRWKVCFSTHFSRQTSGTACHWRMALEGSAEARKLRARSQSLLLDPAGSRSLPTDSAYVEAARCGQPETVHELASSADRRRISIRQDALDTPSPAAESPAVRPAVRRRQEARRRAKPVPQSRSPFDVDESEYAHVSIGGPDQEQDEKPVRRRRRRRHKPAVIGVLLLGVVVLVILAYLGIKLVT